MRFERFEDDGLAHYSYLVADDDSGRAAVVDPRRDVEPYLRYARRHGLRIEHVLETHIHADYASGARELAHRAGAALHLSAYDEGEHYEVSFDHRELREGDEVHLGAVRLRTLHTPGHTPEHVAFLVFEGRDTAPVRFLTGDFLFIGSLGRPDLLGEDAKQALAEDLFHSVRRVIPELPDDLWVHPAHGAGSMCGGGMSRTAERRLGDERRENPFLDPDLDRDAFIRRLLDTLPPYPDYYLRMKERNAGGQGIDRPWPRPVALEPERFRGRADAGAVVLDARHQLGFGGGHVPGALGIGVGVDMSEWAGWVAPYDRPLLLVVEQDTDVERAVTRLARVGLDRVEGYLDGGMEAWVTGAQPLDTLAQWTPAQLAERLAGDGEAGTGSPAGGEVPDTVFVLDVRTADEWQEGHIDGALHVMGGRLQDWLEGGGRSRTPEPPAKDAEIAVVCGTGYRSTVAASILLRHGYRRVRNVPGGMTAWEAAGNPTVG